MSSPMLVRLTSMLVDLTLRHWMLLLTTWLLLRISETVRKIVKALEPPVSAAALLGLRSSRKKLAAPTTWTRGGVKEGNGEG